MKTFEEIAKLAVEKHQHTLGDTYFPSAEAQVFARAVACVALRIYTDEFKTTFSASKPTPAIPKIPQLFVDNPLPSGHAAVSVNPNYVSLLGVLCEALNQAQYGKGAERHNLGSDVPFDRQRMQTVSELVGSPDGMVYQAVKKITEGMKLPTIDRQVAELLGAINYIAGIVLFLRKRANDGACCELAKTWNEPCRWQAPDDKTSHADEPLSDVARSIKVEIDAGTLHDLKQKARRYDEAVSGERPIIPQPHPGRRAQVGEQTAKVEFNLTDPVERVYPPIDDSGWIARSVGDLLAVLNKLNARLSEGNDVHSERARQLLARVWRFNSPILKAIDENAERIEASAARHAGR